MIIATLRVKVPADQRKIFLDSARSVTGPTSVQPDCTSCKFYQDMDDPDNILFVEEWSSWEEYEHHIISDTFRIILSLIDLSEEAPLFKLNTISKTEGLEAIEAVRIGQRI
jgi:quinol monooxygenase YgiN